MAKKTNDYEIINTQYDQSLKAQNKKLKAARDVATSQYNAQIKDATKSYDTMRKQAYTDNALADKTRRESMANMGLSGAGGMSQTLTQRDRSTLLGTLGDATRQQQDYTDNVNLAISNLNTQYNADYASAAAQNASERNAALTSYRQWQKQFDQTQQNTNFKNYFDLLTNNKITKKQFQNLTGIKLK